MKAALFRSFHDIIFVDGRFGFRWSRLPRRKPLRLKRLVLPEAAGVLKPGVRFYLLPGYRVFIYFWLGGDFRIGLKQMNTASAIPRQVNRLGT